MDDKKRKSENLEPKDSRRKHIRHPEDDSESVIKPEDQTYRKEEADFKDITAEKENQEQPVNPIKNPPKDV